MTERVRTLTIRGESLRLLPEGALFWPAESLLVVADLHLGKAETFGRSGFPLPAAAGESDLARLEATARREGARSLLLLGDLVHAREGVTPDRVARFAATLESFPGDVALVAGNHDRATIRNWPAAWSRVSIVPELVRGPFVFRHEPETEARAKREERFVWAGHLHPMVRLHGGPDRIRLKTFFVRDGLGILPAFSSLAGGFDVERGADTRLYPIADGRVFEL